MLRLGIEQDGGRALNSQVKHNSLELVLSFMSIKSNFCF